MRPGPGTLGIALHRASDFLRRRDGRTPTVAAAARDIILNGIGFVFIDDDSTPGRRRTGAPGAAIKGMVHGEVALCRGGAERGRTRTVRVRRTVTQARPAR